VDTVGNGMSALQKIQSFDYDLIICDIEMPVMDGVEFFELAMIFDPSIKDRFMVLSGHSDKYRDFISKNGLPCINKPFTTDELVKWANNRAHRKRDGAAMQMAV